MLKPVLVFNRKKLNPSFKKALVREISKLIPDNSYVLDYGCDDGKVAEAIMRIKPSVKIVGIDVQGDRSCQIPRKIYDGKKIPYKSNTFDVVVSLDVLHHTKDIKASLKELKRVSKKYIIIKDHAVYSEFSKKLLTFTDYMTNLEANINCAYNFPYKEKWYEMFKELKFKLLKEPQNIHFSYFRNERYNPIFMIELSRLSYPERDFKHSPELDTRRCQKKYYQQSL